MMTRSDPAALLPLAAPLMCWHESRFSARTDLLVFPGEAQALLLPFLTGDAGAGPQTHRGGTEQH